MVAVRSCSVSFARSGYTSELGDRQAATSDYERSVLLDPQYAQKDYRVSITYYTTIIYSPYYIGGYYRSGAVVYYNTGIFYDPFYGGTYRNRPQIINIYNSPIIQVDPSHQRRGDGSPRTIIIRDRTINKATNGINPTPVGTVSPRQSDRQVTITNPVSPRPITIPLERRDRQVTITQPTIDTVPSEHRSRRERPETDRQPVFDRAMPSQQFRPERGRSEAAPNIPESDRHRSRQR